MTLLTTFPVDRGSRLHRHGASIARLGAPRPQRDFPAAAPVARAHRLHAKGPAGVVGIVPGLELDGGAYILLFPCLSHLDRDLAGGPHRGECRIGRK